MTLSRSARLVLVAMLAMLPACTSTTWRGRFTPTPAEAVVQEADGAEPVARILMSVRGAERPGGDPEADFEMIVRLRVENESAEPLTLALDRFLLLDAALEAFGRPRVLPPQDDAPTVDADALADGVAPGAFALLELAFPFPPGRGPGDLNLSGLNLRGAVVLGDTELPVGATFARTPRVVYREPWPYPYGPYWYGPWYGPYGRSSLHVRYGYGW